MATERGGTRHRLSVYDQRDQFRKDLKAASDRLADQIEQRALDVETGLSANLGALRDLVVGTTDGGRRAYVAVGLLVVGLLLQTWANILSLV